MSPEDKKKVIQMSKQRLHYSHTKLSALKKWYLATISP